MNHPLCEICNSRLFVRHELAPTPVYNKSCGKYWQGLNNRPLSDSYAQGIFIAKTAYNPFTPRTQRMAALRVTQHSFLHLRRRAVEL